METLAILTQLYFITVDGGLNIRLDKIFEVIGRDTFNNAENQLIFFLSLYTCAKKKNKSLPSSNYTRVHFVFSRYTNNSRTNLN